MEWEGTGGSRLVGMELARAQLKRECLAKERGFVEITSGVRGSGRRGRGRGVRRGGCKGREGGRVCKRVWTAVR